MLVAASWEAVQRISFVTTSRQTPMARCAYGGSVTPQVSTPSIRKSLAGAAVHAATWIAIAILVGVLTTGTSASVAYGMVSGWWATLYVGRLAKVGVESMIPLALGYAALAMISVPLGWSFLYHDPPPRLSFPYVSSIFTAALLFASPTVVNWLVGTFEKRIVSNR
jgi:hypothetical protein